MALTLNPDADPKQERQYLYQEFSLQMHGKNRKMLKGYRQDNTKIDSSHAHKEYSADPSSRYNNYHDRAQVDWARGALCLPYISPISPLYLAQVDWARGARLGATKGHPNLAAVANLKGRRLTGGV